DIVEHDNYIHDNYIPTNKGVKISRSSWNKEQKTWYLLNLNAKNFLIKSIVASHPKKYETLLLKLLKVRDSKISILVHKYELFKMEDNEIIDLIFRRFEKIINNLKSLGKTYDNYNHMAKFLRRKTYDNYNHLAKFEKHNVKAFKVEESCGDTSDKDCFDKDQLSFISRKIQSLWKHKIRSRWKNNFKKHTKEMKDKK
ncbi:hypothetical protein CR513_32843, partial [Mucuna pruriens]